MFSLAARSAPAPGARVEALRLSLNAPVVALEALPVGPATAAIALLGGAGPRLVVVVRSNRSGRLLRFEPEPGLCEAHGEEVALEAAVSFAEGMGFLFDHDEAPRGAAEAGRLWAGFVDEGAAEEPGDGPEAGALGDPGDAAVVPPAPPLLSKFRFQAAIPAERLMTPPPPEPPRRTDFWLRLLSRF